ASCIVSASPYDLRQLADEDQPHRPESLKAQRVEAAKRTAVHLAESRRLLIAGAPDQRPAGVHPHLAGAEPPGPGRPPSAASRIDVCAAKSTTNRVRAVLEFMPITVNSTQAASMQQEESKEEAPACFREGPSPICQHTHYIQKFRCDKWRKILFAVFVILLPSTPAITRIATLSTNANRHPVFLATLFNAFNRNGQDAYSDSIKISHPKLKSRNVQLKRKTWLPACLRQREPAGLDYETSLHKSGIFPIPKIRHNSLGQRVSCPQKMHIMKVDMFRYMLMYKLGGTYARRPGLQPDAKPWTSFVASTRWVTREPETHSLQLFGPHMRPLDPLSLIRPNWDILGFAGPVGLTRILERYNAKHPADKTTRWKRVYVPPSFSFYPYENNSLSGVSTNFRNYRLSKMSISCRKLNDTKRSAHARLRKVKNLTQLCSNITNYNPVTDSSPTVYAVHDMRKERNELGWAPR
uniref:Exostosin domain-containing protein n=1 Tax=Macrostomum lignano TaxID=282301 RepID=A0A1I8FAI7_9PLAT